MGGLGVSEKTRLAAGLVGLALGMGVLGDWLFRAGALGLNVGMWWGGARMRARGRSPSGEGCGSPGAAGGWWCPGLAFAFAFAWRDSVSLNLANTLSLLVCVVLAATRSRAGRIAVASLWDYAVAGIATALSVSAGLLVLVLGDVKWGEMPRGKGTGQLAAVGRGLAIAIPVLLVFGSLFAAADAVFSSLAADLLHWDPAEIMGHLLFIGFWAVVAGGLARQTLLGGLDAYVPAVRSSWISVGMVEVATVLGAVDLLFLAFVGVQFRYFFGGAELVQATAHLTYAEYARRGFFELVAVAALTLPSPALGGLVAEEEGTPGRGSVQGTGWGAGGDGVPGARLGDAEDAAVPGGVRNDRAEAVHDGLHGLAGRGVRLVRGHGAARVAGAVRLRGSGQRTSAGGGSEPVEPGRVHRGCQRGSPPGGQEAGCALRCVAKRGRCARAGEGAAVPSRGGAEGRGGAAGEEVVRLTGPGFPPVELGQAGGAVGSCREIRAS